MKEHSFNEQLTDWQVAASAIGNRRLGRILGGPDLPHRMVKSRMMTKLRLMYNNNNNNNNKPITRRELYEIDYYQEDTFDNLIKQFDPAKYDGTFVINPSNDIIVEFIMLRIWKNSFSSSFISDFSTKNYFFSEYKCGPCLVPLKDSPQTIGPGSTRLNMITLPKKNPLRSFANIMRKGKSAPDKI